MVPTTKELSSPPRSQIIREGSKECPGAPRKEENNNSRYSLHETEFIPIRLFPVVPGGGGGGGEKEEEDEEKEVGMEGRRDETKRTSFGRSVGHSQSVKRQKGK